MKITGGCFEHLKIGKLRNQGGPGLIAPKSAREVILRKRKHQESVYQLITGKTCREERPGDWPTPEFRLDEVD